MDHLSHGVNVTGAKNSLFFLKSWQRATKKGAQMVFQKFVLLPVDSNGPSNHNLRHKSNKKLFMKLVSILVECMRIYTSLCWSVGPSVRPLVGNHFAFLGV